MKNQDPKINTDLKNENDQHDPSKNKSDVKVLKQQNKETKNSDHPEQNAANAKSNPGKYKSTRK